MALIHIAHLTLNVNIDQAALEALQKSVNINTQILKQLLMTNEELLASLTAANTKLDKIATEVQALKDKVNNTPGVPQDIVDAVNALTTKLQAVDDLNEDAPAEETQG